MFRPLFVKLFFVERAVYMQLRIVARDALRILINQQTVKESTLQKITPDKTSAMRKCSHSMFK